MSGILTDNLGRSTGLLKAAAGGGAAGSDVMWISGDSSGNVIHAGTTHSAGGQLTTTGKALVMGF